VEAQIVLREVTSSAADFAKLLYARGANGYAGADGGAVALCADELEEDAMIAIGVTYFFRREGGSPTFKRRTSTLPGVEDVAEGSATAGLQGQILEACLFGNFVKRAVAIVAMQQQRLAKARTGFQRVDLGIDVAVGDKKIEPGVIVHVEESGAPQPT